ncbi:MAG: helix-turn-helix transcriptional regulator [Alphaproteobacteria bacterium]|nr:helix-turn-helix transcriptional regulator [Alphaproteobacteria bacterium]
MTRSTDRSTDPKDYQHVPRPVAAMPKPFKDGAIIPPHRHRRAQLIYAATGVMRVTTAAGAFVVPPQRALWVPPGEEHSLAMRGEVAMRTLYVEPKAARAMPRSCVVIEVSALLRALVDAAMAEPVLYDPRGRGGMIMRLLLRELKAAPRLKLSIPMPEDRRLQRLCGSLLRHPQSDATLEHWAEHVGASARNLERLFRRETGMSFGAWRQQARLVEALAQLAGGQPVGQVARRLGYRSASAFTQMFRRALGRTPRDYVARAPRT